MSCFGNKPAPDYYENCCNAGCLCEFNGKLDDVFSTPIYAQSVYDAVLFNLQGMKTVQNQRFSPNLPCGHCVERVVDIRCRKVFNPANVDDPRNLTLDVDTSISGATFLQNCHGDQLQVIGPDGTLSEKILYADTTECDEKCKGTPIFGTQNVSITGNVIVYIDLLISDKCGCESVFTVCAEVNISTPSRPLVLTNFFEICMPSTMDTAFLPRFTELSNSACECRLATNSCGRDITVGPEGEICGNLIVALCVSCEKKVVVPVQLCVLSNGFAEIPTQTNPICTTFPSLFPNHIGRGDTVENCGNPCDPCHDHGHESCDPCGSSNCNTSCDCDPCGGGCGCECTPSKPEPCGCDPCRPQPRHKR